MNRKTKVSHSFFEEGYVQSSSAHIYYCAYGTGKPIILLHGSNGDSSFFKKQIEFFRQRYRVITIDSRGHGKSSSGQQPLTIPVMANDVRNVIEHLGLKDVFILGFSDGGNVALQLSLNSDENIQALVIISGNLYPSGIKSYVRLPIQMGYVICNAFRKIKWFNEKREILSLMANEPNMEPRLLQKIKMPVLILVGEHDIIKPAHTKLMADSITHATLKIVMHGRHFFLTKQHRKANQLIFDFLLRHTT